MEAKIKTAVFFAIISTMINILYYWIQVGFSLEFWSMVVISPIIPITIYYYSELIKDTSKDPKIEQQLVPQYEPVLDQLTPNYESTVEVPEQGPLLQTFENGEPVNPLKIADSAQDHDFIDRIEPTPPGAWGTPKISNKKMGKK
jgi:hypothetical protein